MDEQLIDLNSEISLSRVLNICRSFDYMKPWKRLLTINRRCHPSGEALVPYRLGDEGVLYRIEDILKFISLNVPGMSFERAQEAFLRYEVSRDSELDELLQSLDEDSDDFEGCFLDHEDFHDALRAVFKVEDGIGRLTDNLVALTKLCEGMAATGAQTDEPTAAYLSSFGWSAVNDAEKLLFKLENLVDLLCRNCDDEYEGEMVEVGLTAAKEVA